jgi:23S rRNA G2069 N7-methylase RlmK/C1962 C5-methylase RlmI
MQEQTEKPVIRRRINVDTSTKGVKTASATFESTGLTKQEHEEQSEDYFQWVEANWPAPITLNA